ncbi:LicD family protein [Furfurilactobacillus cerevisiae]|uniref:LicD family protein n=1 Tax=Furfurilactobacillus rossiae TaxID=231049 RepID=UPI003B985B97
MQLSTEDVRQRFLEMMDHVQELCSKNKLNLFMDGGTLLGAVRHHGFIPWDDDVDFVLWRQDYETLLALLRKDKKYRLMDLNSSEYPYTYAKLIDPETKVDEAGAGDIGGYGLFIDFFPLDNIPSGKIRQELFVRKIITMRKISRGASEKYSLKSVYKRVGVKLLQHVNAHKLAVKVNDKAQRYNKRDTEVCFDLLGTNNYKLYQSAWFSRAVPMKFEGHDYYAPVNFQAYLHSLYGNYMEIPDADHRETHHLRVFLK